MGFHQDKKKYCNSTVIYHLALTKKIRLNNEYLQKKKTNKKLSYFHKTFSGGCGTNIVMKPTDPFIKKCKFVTTNIK